jgi:hypothetical protein
MPFSVLAWWFLLLTPGPPQAPNPTFRPLTRGVVVGPFGDRDTCQTVAQNIVAEYAFKSIGIQGCWSDQPRQTPPLNQYEPIRARRKMKRQLLWLRVLGLLLMFIVPTAILVLAQGTSLPPRAGTYGFNSTTVPNTATPVALITPGFMST